MKLTITATVEQFDPVAYGAAVRDAIRKCFMKAGQKFLLAAIPRIHIWTGMARGAFRNLEDIVGKVTNDAQSGNVRIRTTQNKKGSPGRGGGQSINQKYRKGYFYQIPGGAKIARTPQSGRQFATDPLKIIEAGGETTKTGNTSYHFRFEVNIKYADDRNWWEAFHSGEEAFTAYVKQNLVLPDPLKFMTRKTFKV